MFYRSFTVFLLVLALLFAVPVMAEAKLVSDGLGNVYDDGLPEELPPQQDVPQLQIPADDDTELDSEAEDETEEDAAPQPIEPDEVVVPGEDAEDELLPEVEVPELLLTDLIVEGVELDRDFSPYRYRYKAYVSSEVTEVWVAAEAEYGRISINSQRGSERSVPLSGAEKDINIVLEADGEQVTYTVTVYRSAPAVEHTLYLQIGHSFALLDGEALKMDAPPELADGRTMVPLRLVAEALGASVAWVAEERRVDIAYDGQLLQLLVGVATDGLDVPPYIKNSRTMVPLRYIMETFGADVSWNAADKSITITFVEGE